MNDAKLVNIARLMTTYNLEIEQLPDNLKCAQCKLVLKDACQIPCGCRFCLACMDDMMSRGDKFCPGDLPDCGDSPLLAFVLDYETMATVSKLSVKCPQNGCVHECQLANMDEHLRECPRKIEKCPFREFGYTRDNLAAEEIGGHLLQENRRHRELLIEMKADFNRQIDTLKHELELKDQQIKSIMNQVMYMQNENKSMKEGKEDLAGRKRISSAEMEQEIDEKRKIDELDSTVIEQMDGEIAADSGLIGSNSADEMQSVRSDHGLINQSPLSLISEVSIVNPQVQVYDGCEWLIDRNLEKDRWSWGSGMWSPYFYGTAKPYYFRLGSKDYGPEDFGKLVIKFRLYRGDRDDEVTWPFEAKVSVTVADENCSDYSRTFSRQCRLERGGESELFEYPRSDLIDRDLNLRRGVRVTCLIVYSAPR